MNEDDYYGLLGVPQDADKELIRTAYRKLITLYHPDKHGNDFDRRSAQEIFTKISQAYTGMFIKAQF